MNAYIHAVRIDRAVDCSANDLLLSVTSGSRNHGWWQVPCEWSLGMRFPTWPNSREEPRLEYVDCGLCTLVQRPRREYSSQVFLLYFITPAWICLCISSDYSLTSSGFQGLPGNQVVVLVTSGCCCPSAADEEWNSSIHRGHTFSTFSICIIHTVQYCIDTHIAVYVSTDYMYLLQDSAGNANTFIYMHTFIHTYINTYGESNGRDTPQSEDSKWLPNERKSGSLLSVDLWNGKGKERKVVLPGLNLSQQTCKLMHTHTHAHYIWAMPNRMRVVE